MKKLLFIGGVLLLAASCTSSVKEDSEGLSKLEEKIKKEEADKERKMEIQYESMVTDMCGCFNEATADLTEEGRKVIEDAGQGAGSMEAAMEAYGERSPENAMHDGLILMSLGQADVMTCVQSLEDKYKDLYTTDSQAQIQAKMILLMKDLEDCKLTYAFIKAGLTM